MDVLLPLPLKVEVPLQLKVEGGMKEEEVEKEEEVKEEEGRKNQSLSLASIICSSIVICLECGWVGCIFLQPL